MDRDPELTDEIGDAGLRLHTAGSLGEFLRRTRSVEDREAAWAILAPLLDDASADVRRFARSSAAELPAAPRARRRNHPG